MHSYTKITFYSSETGEKAAKVSSIERKQPAKHVSPVQKEPQQESASCEVTSEIDSESPAKQMSSRVETSTSDSDVVVTRKDTPAVKSDSVGKLLTHN